MNKAAVKDTMYGAITELMTNPLFYWRSPIGSLYSNWTEAGKVALHELVEKMTPIIDQADRDEKADAAKNFLFSTLKGDA